MKRYVHLVLPGVAVISLAALVACGGGKVAVYTSAAPATPAVTTAPAAPSAVVVTTVPPTPAPPVQVAVLGASPGSEYIRVEGHYSWVGDRYEWAPATWVRVPYPGAIYVPGHWQATAGGYTWMPGYWR